MSEEGSKSEKATGSTPSGGGGNKLVLILSILNFLVVLGVGGIVFVSYQKEKQKEALEDLESAHGEDAGGGEHASGGHNDAHGKKEEHGGGGHGAPTAEAGHGGGGHGGGGHGGGHGAAAIQPKQLSNLGKIVQLEQFTVNLTQAGQSNATFIRLNVSVEVQNEDAETEIQQRIPQVRNAIIDLLNGKKTNDLSTVEGREYLKEEIKNAINHFMISGKVKGVYFTNFTVSS